MTFARNRGRLRISLVTLLNVRFVVAPSRGVSFVYILQIHSYIENNVASLTILRVDAAKKYDFYPNERLIGCYTDNGNVKFNRLIRIRFNFFCF